MDEPREKAPAALGEAYISGALTALDDGPRTKLFYELLAEIAEAAGLRAYLPHRVTDPVAAAHLDPRSVYEIDRAHVTSAAVLIAYAGIPSFGVGIEVEVAREHAVPVIVVALGKTFFWFVRLETTALYLLTAGVAAEPMRLSSVSRRRYAIAG